VKGGLGEGLGGRVGTQGKERLVDLGANDGPSLL